MDHQGQMEPAPPQGWRACFWCGQRLPDRRGGGHYCNKNCERAHSNWCEQEYCRTHVCGICGRPLQNMGWTQNVDNPACSQECFQEHGRRSVINTKMQSEQWNMQFQAQQRSEFFSKAIVGGILFIIIMWFLMGI